MDLKTFGKDALGFLSGGSNQTNYSYNDQGQMQTTQTPLSTGQMFKNMFAGMISGLAGGVQANREGMHGALGAFAGGAEANMARLQGIDQQKRQAAAQQFQAGQEAKKTAMAQSQVDLQNKEMQGKIVQQQLQNGLDAFKLAHTGAQLQQDQADKFNQLQDLISSHPGSESIGFFKDDQQLYAAEKKATDDMIAAHVQGQVHAMPVVDNTGKVVGVELWKIPKSFLESTNKEPLPWDIYKTDDKGVVQKETIMIPPGSITMNAYLTKRAEMPKGAVTPAELEKDTNQLKVQSLKDDVMLQRMNFMESMQTQRLMAAVDLARQKGEVLDDKQKDQIVDMVGNYQVDPNKLRFTRGELVDIMDKVHKKYSHYSDISYDSAKEALKKLTAGPDHLQIMAADKALNHNLDLRNLVEKMPYSGDVKVINKWLQSAARQMGVPELGSVDVLKTALKEELAKSTKGGTPDIALEKQFDSAFSTENGHKMLLAALDQAAQVTQQNVATIANQAVNNIPGLQNLDIKPNLSAGAQESLAKRGLDNPFNYGQFPKPGRGDSATAPKWAIDKALKQVGGDPQRATNLLQQNGWQ